MECFNAAVYLLYILYSSHRHGAASGETEVQLNAGYASTLSDGHPSWKMSTAVALRRLLLKKSFENCKTN
jgi:hypothetical protein